MKNTKIANIRALAIAIVVLGHSIILYTGAWDFVETNRSIPNIMILKHFINAVEMPLFMSISGYSFCYSMRKNPGAASFFTNKVRRLLLPYLFASGIWMNLTRSMLHAEGWQHGFLGNILYNTILMSEIGLGHLWYLISLFIIFAFWYTVIKLIDKLGADSPLFDFILLGSAFFLSITVKSAEAIQIDSILIKRTCYYIFWFYLGYFLNKHYGEYLLGKTNYPAGLSAAIVFIVSFVTYEIKPDTITYYATAFSFVLAAYLLMPDKTNRVISLIERDSYGIYLFHSPMIYFTFTVLANRNPYMVVFINFFVLGLIAILITETLRRTPLVWAIGEKQQKKTKSVDV